MSGENKVMELARKYLEDYLPLYLKGVGNDPKILLDGISVPFGSLKQFGPEELEFKDDHVERFLEIYSMIPFASTRGFAEAVSKMDDAIVLDIGSMWYGQDFGLWVASKNKSAQVYVYNPCVPKGFPDFLFNEQKKDEIFKFQKKAEFDSDNIEGSINLLYHENGLSNIRYCLDFIGRDGIYEHIRSAGKSPVVLFSYRAPVAPEEMAAQIAEIAGCNKNVEMVIAPLINMPLNSCHDDPLMKEISRNYKITQSEERDAALDPIISAKARIVTAMNIYYASKLAEISGGKVYKQDKPFCLGVYPSNFVSTIMPEKNRF